MNNAHVNNFKEYIIYEDMDEFKNLFPTFFKKVVSIISKTC